MRLHLFSFIFYIFFVKCKCYVSNQDLVNSVVFIFKNYFEGDCLALVTLQEDSTQLELLLLKQLHKLHGIYILHPVNHTLNKVPYPCFYIILVGLNKHILDSDATMSSRFFLNKETKRSKYVAIAENTLNLQESYKGLLSLFSRGHPDAILLNREETITVYTLYPYGEDMRSCPENRVQFKFLDKWINNMFTVDLFPYKVPKLFNGCQLNVSYIEYVPYTINVENNVEGIDGDIVRLVGESLNMSIVWILREDIYIAKDDGYQYGVLPDVLYGRTHLACGGLINYPLLTGYVHLTTTYATSHLTWYLPYPPYEPTWKTMYKAFQPTLLIYSIAVMFIVPAFVAVIAKKTAYELPYFKCITRCYVAAWALAVGNTTGNRPRTTPVRIIYIFWLIYTIHLALAYTASLTGLLTKNAHRPKVRTFNHLVNTGLPTATKAILHLSTLNIADAEVRQALDKVLIINDTDTAIRLIERYGNMSLLDNSVYVDYKICKKSRRKSMYNSGLSTYPMQTGLMMRKSHFLFSLVNNIVTRIVESGINEKVVKEVAICRKPNRRLKSGKYKASTLSGLSGTFLILAAGLLISSVTFFIELFIYRRKLKRIEKKLHSSHNIPYLN